MVDGIVKRVQKKAIDLLNEHPEGCLSGTFMIALLTRWRGLMKVQYRLSCLHLLAMKEDVSFFVNSIQ